MAVTMTICLETALHRIVRDFLHHGIQCVLDMGSILGGILAIASKDTLTVKAHNGDLHTALFLQGSAKDTSRGNQTAQSQGFALDIAQIGQSHGHGSVDLLRSHHLHPHGNTSGDGV